MAAQGLPPSEKEPRLYGSLTAIIIRLISLAALDAFALWFLYELVSDEVWFLAITIVVVTLAINVVFLNDRLYPFRWFSPGLALMILMVAYPTLFTIYTAFTNYSTGNLLTENRAIERIEEKPEYRYLPEGQQAYHWLRSSYRNPEGDYLLWLVGYQDGRVLVAREGEELRSPTPEESGLEGVTFNPAGDIPLELAGHEYLAPSEAATELADTKYLMFGEPIGLVQVAAIDDETQAEGYVYDPAQALLADYSRRGQRSPAILYRDIEDQSYALWIADEEPMLAPEGVPLSAADLQAGFDCCQLPRLPTVEAAAVTVTPPDMIGEYEKLSIGTITREGLTQELPQIRFGETDDPLYVNANANDQAGRFRQLYSYDEERGVMVNRVTEDIYEPVEGTFTLQRTLQEGEETPVELSPGYYTVIGLDNFDRLITDERLRDPFVRIFLWTFAHAFLAVFLTFSLGLALALLMNDQIVPQRKLFRSLILIPYAIPAFISTLIWRGLLNPRLGLINNWLEFFVGEGNAPAWYSSPTWAKVGILLIQLWLGFPYMLLICTGALQAIPTDIYEAAKVDGASGWQQFRTLTLPLILVTTGPLLIASFAFNFNNFTVIELFNEGGPPIAGSSVPAGHSDILITYTYAQAFGSGGGTDYAFASAITIVIFLIVAAVTIFNFRFTRAWEEVSENV